MQCQYQRALYPHCCPGDFGVKLDMSITNGYVRIEKIFFNTYKESECVIVAVKRYKERAGVYPERVLVYKIYQNRINFSHYKQLGIRISGRCSEGQRRIKNRQKTRLNRQLRSNRGRIKRLCPSKKIIRALVYSNTP